MFHILVPAESEEKLMFVNIHNTFTEFLRGRVEGPVIKDGGNRGSQIMIVFCLEESLGRDSTYFPLRVRIEGAFQSWGKDLRMWPFDTYL